VRGRRARRRELRRSDRGAARHRRPGARPDIRPRASPPAALGRDERGHEPIGQTGRRSPRTPAPSPATLGLAIMFALDRVALADLRARELDAQLAGECGRGSRRVTTPTWRITDITSAARAVARAPADELPRAIASRHRGPYAGSPNAWGSPPHRARAPPTERSAPTANMHVCTATPSAPVSGSRATIE